LIFSCEGLTNIAAKPEKALFFDAIQFTDKAVNFMFWLKRRIILPWTQNRHIKSGCWRSSWCYFWRNHEQP